jgi:DNA-directed RNA polymerase subunit RPC12/RpoP
LGVFYGIYWIGQTDKRKCVELGYLCPECGRPLYSSKGYEKITGRCPSCQKSVN